METAFTPDNIHRMVHGFYDRVRRDDVLGPVFDEALPHGWDVHLPRMVEFWSTVLLGSGTFQGNVFGKHMALHGIEKEHFVRWLALFHETVTTLYAGAQAEEVLLVAQRIAGSLQLGYFGKKLV
ncbi:hemoglobin [Paucimonas lemoignei]|uniref:Hemoglobin n=1 Tax=Paucimonas lemoignei TaxID=29443 RepID=A0A4V2UJ17_PAULE|nr:group III truncated hemoglobin [Paucimonas lemoignei]TCS38300.1 hemoglobin [Paucimonas lemoignei]